MNNQIELNHYNNFGQNHNTSGNNNIPSTNNKIENIFQKVFPKHIKRTMKIEQRLFNPIHTTLGYKKNKKEKNHTSFLK